jgi:hypothetical protein
VFTLEDVFHSTSWQPDLIANTAKFLEESKPKIDNFFSTEHDVSHLRILNEVYWDFLNLIIRAKVRNPAFILQGFTEPERLFIDFGLLDGRFLESEHEIDKLLAEINGKPKDKEITVRLLSEELVMRYRGIMRGSKSSALERDITAIEQQAQKTALKLKRLHFQRAKLYDMAKDPIKLKDTSQVLDNLLSAYARFAGAAGQSKLPSPEGAKVQAALESARENLHAEESRQYADIAARRALSTFTNDIIKSAVEYPSLKMKVLRLKSQLKRRDEAGAVHSTGEMYTKLGGFISEIQKVTYHYSGREGRNLYPLFFQKTFTNTRSRIREHYSLVMQVDRLFAGKVEKGEWPRPAFVILPGLGDGFFSKPRNILWVPLKDIFTYKASPITALASCRFLRTDGMPRRYAEVKGFYRKANIPALMTEFIKDYNTWMLKEARGFRKMPGKMHKWFRYELSYGGEGEDALHG